MASSSCLIAAMDRSVWHASTSLPKLSTGVRCQALERLIYRGITEVDKRVLTERRRKIKDQKAAYVRACSESEMVMKCWAIGADKRENVARVSVVKLDSNLLAAIRRKFGGYSQVAVLERDGLYCPSRAPNLEIESDDVTHLTTCRRRGYLV